MALFSVSNKSLDPAALSKELQDDRAGALATFEGWVRNKNEGHDVTALEYEVFHDLACTEGEKILAEAIDKFNLSNAIAVHREGKLAIGECAIWIGATAPHRAEAFDACRYIIDEMKHRLPVWKKEHYVDQTPQWVNCQHHHHHTPPTAINDQDYYARQMILPHIGEEGQNALSKAKVLIVGAGGLGSSAALALAGAGIGTIGIADHDILSASNLHRQILYSVNDIGKPKAHLAATRLKSLNPLIEVQAIHEKVTADNAEILFSDYDMVLDCTDNFTAKYLLNDAAMLYKTPVIQASIYQFEGQLLKIDPESNGGCLRCLFDDAPEPGMVGDCATAGVLGTVPMLFGTMQANEAIKHILGLETNKGLMTFDLLSMQAHTIGSTRNHACPLCGDNPTIKGLEPNIEFVAEPRDTAETIGDQFTIVDVRESDEVARTPLSIKSLHNPLSDFKLHEVTIEKDTPILTICARGARSLQAAKILRQAGWHNVYSLAGGVENLPKIQNKGKAA